MNETHESSEVERAEAQLWEAVRAFCEPGVRERTVAAARAVEALGRYRAAVEAHALASRVGRVAVAA
jgi:hypothetical protein